MFELILLVYLAFRNGVRANPVLWGFITAGAFFSAMVIGFMLVVSWFCKDVIDLNVLPSLDPKAQEVAMQQLLLALSRNQLHILTIELFGIGGYLLIRFILERKPDKKEPEIHWMDRMGGDQ
jgi:hypothetical protein